MKFILVIWSVLFFIGSSLVLCEEGSNNSPIEVSFCQISNNPLLFIGKRIKIRAVYRYTVEIQTLESPVCCSETDLTRIWVEIDANIEHRSAKLFRKIDGGHGIALVTFVGRFDGNETYGYFGDKYQLEVDEILNIEKNI